MFSLVCLDDGICVGFGFVVVSVSFGLFYDCIFAYVLIVYLECVYLLSDLCTYLLLV